MLFNSIEFGFFLPIVFILYWFVTKRNLKLQNSLLLLASYFFYGWWDWRFLSLIIVSTLVDYSIGLGMRKYKSPISRKALLSISILVNVGLLGFFKYFNFFIDSFSSAFTFFGHSLGGPTLNIILPVGISFYTFQTMSYTIDVYRSKMEPSKDFLSFAAFVAFFPQLVAGPIERASNLLPQMARKRKFETAKAAEGVRLMLWGLFKKIVIADNLAPSVNDIFANYHSYTSEVLVLGVVFFAFQIYCDFSGYSDIARGIAKLLGFELMVNFNFPYFSRSIGEFWRRWHISLSTWFRDYIYIPLGGSKVGKYKGIRNVFIIFLVSGFWHGANWTFIIWGGIHALLFVPSYIAGNNRKYLNDLTVNRFLLPKIGDILRILWVFVLVCFAWIFFRSDSVFTAIEYIQGIFQFSFSPGLYLNPYDNQALLQEIILLSSLVLIEYLLVTRTISLIPKQRFIDLVVDAGLIVLILLRTPVSDNLSFIYFQF